MVTCASLPFFSVIGASPTEVISSAGNSLMPYTSVRLAMLYFFTKIRLASFSPVGHLH